MRKCSTWSDKTLVFSPVMLEPGDSGIYPGLKLWLDAGVGVAGTSNLPNIEHYSHETQQAIEELIQEIFSVEDFLSEAQGRIIAKIKLGKKLSSSTERNTKRQLRKKIRKAEYMKDFWKDLEDLL